MKPHRTPLRGTLLLAAPLLLAVLAARPCAAQSCSASIRAGGKCTIVGVTAAFSANASGSVNLVTDTVGLNAGWVYMNPPGSNDGDVVALAWRVDTVTTPPPPTPVIVKTKYTIAGSPSDTSAIRPGVSISTELYSGIGAGRYLVGYPSDTVVIVAVLSGNLTTPGGPQVGCQTTYSTVTRTGAFGPRVLAVLQDSIPGARIIRGGRDTIPAVANIPQNCFAAPCPTSVSTGTGRLACAIGGYNAIFGPGTGGTVSTAGNDSIALASGLVYLSPSSGETSIVVTTGYVATDSVGTALDTTNVFEVTGDGDDSFLVEAFGTDSMFVAVTDGTVAVTNETISLTQRRQYLFSGAGYRTNGTVHRYVTRPATIALLCTLGAYPLQSVYCP